MKLYIIWQQMSHYRRLPLPAELLGGSASESIDAELLFLKSLRHSIMGCGAFFAMTKSLACRLWNWKLAANAIHAGLAFCISIPAACLSTLLLLLLWSVYKVHIHYMPLDIWESQSISSGAVLQLRWLVLVCWNFSLQCASLCMMHPRHPMSLVRFWKLLRWRAARMQFIWYERAQYFEECPPMCKETIPGLCTEKASWVQLPKKLRASEYWK